MLRHKSDNHTDHELILKMELPFEIENTSVYIAILVTQFLHEISAASLSGAIDSLLITLVSSSV